jgi:hypothetical protein
MIGQIGQLKWTAGVDEPTHTVGRDPVSGCWRGRRGVNDHEGTIRQGFRCERDTTVAAKGADSVPVAWPGETWSSRCRMVSSFCSMPSSWVGAVCAGDVATPASERPNAEEAAEKRKDAQVAREIVLALPANAALTDEDRIGLVRPSRARRQTGVRRDRPPAWCRRS